MSGTDTSRLPAGDPSGGDDPAAVDPAETDPSAPEVAADPGRKRYELDDRGFREVPKKWRKFYRHWGGPLDELAPNEVVCPVCKVVIRATSELRPGDKVYCMPCMSRMVVVEGEGGRLEAEVIF